MIRLLDLLKEDDIVKNKKTGNVYVVKQMDPAKHDKATPDEIEKAKAKSGGVIPKVGQEPTTPQPQANPQAKPQQPVAGQKPSAQKPAAQPTQPQTGEAPPPGKLSGSDFKSSAEKSVEKTKSKSKSDIPMLKDLMPNANFDRKPTVPGTNLYCDGNKGIPREDMPQFKGTPEPGSIADKLPKDENGEADTEEFFKQMLNKQGIKVSEPAAVPADRLKATQSELVGPKVAGMSKVLADPNHPAYGKITAPIYVSNDGYVLDGHHRWAAVVAHNASNPDNQIPMNVRVIDEPIEPLVKRSNKFAEEIGIRAKKADTGAAGGPSPITK